MVWTPLVARSVKLLRWRGCILAVIRCNRRGRMEGWAGKRRASFVFLGHHVNWRRISPMLVKGGLELTTPKSPLLTLKRRIHHLRKISRMFMHQPNGNIGSCKLICQAWRQFMIHSRSSSDWEKKKNRMRLWNSILKCERTNWKRRRRVRLTWEE